MQPIKRLFKNKKGIDTILAALLMVVIVVVASVMVYAWSTGLLGGLLVTPQTGKEALSLENTSFSGNATATLSIRNIGTASITMVTYYVKDNSGNQYASGITGFAWSNVPPATAPNGLAITTINIGASCSAANCQYTGTNPKFAFVSGNSYTVIVITSRNNQFTFTIVR